MEKRREQNGRKQRKRRGPRRRRRLSAFAWFLIVAVLTLAGTACTLVFTLKIQTVEITGRTRYSDAQILKAAGIVKGSRILLFDRKAAESQITSRLPYVRRADIAYKPFTGLKVALVPDKAFLAAEIEGGYAIVDEDCKVLEVTDKALEGLAVVKGTGIKGPVPGRQVDAAPKARLARAAEIVNGFHSQKLDKLVSVDVSNNLQLSACYDNRITIVLGTAADLDKKIRSAQYMISNGLVQPEEKGTLDVSQSVQMGEERFQPS